MRRPRLLPLLAVLALGGVLAGPAAAEQDTYLVAPGGRILGTRTLDADGDGRRDLVVLLRRADGGEELAVLRTPARPVARTFYPPDHITRIDCGGARARDGAVAIGRFGPRGAARIRFLGPDGATDLTPAGRPAERTARHAPPALFARSAGRPLVFWDGVADLDGDGVDECWYPLAQGDAPLRVLGGVPSGDVRLGLETQSRAASTGQHLLARYAYVPNLFQADLDGDGRRELVALRDHRLLGWSVGPAADGGKPRAPAFALTLPFLERAPELGPDDLRTPRIQIEDVDGDGHADLLVTLITGVRTRLASIRTILFHYPGPFRDPATGKLVPPKTRIDTQSIVLHPTFVDVDGDGARDYVGDSIRGSMVDLIARMMGKDPRVTFVGFRYDRAQGTFERTPYFSFERTYASAQALNNTFGRSGWFAGDFDGDGHKDLLDLGNLEGVEILRGAKGGRGAVFTEALLGRIPVRGGLRPAAQVVDLNGDERADAVLWSEDKLYLVVSKGGGR